MRKATLTVMLILMALLFGITTAQPATDSAVLRLAAVMPAESEVYVSMRVDDGYIATLDSLIARVANVAAEFDSSISVPTLRQIIAQALPTDPANVDAVLDWMGQSLALGAVVNSSGQTSSVFFAVELSDRAAAEAYLEDNFGGIGDKESRGSLTVYAGEASTLIVSDALLIITDGDVDSIISGDYPKLSNQPDFQQALSGLPADAYNIVAYVAQSVLLPQGAEMLGSVALGATILDETTLTLDLALSGAALPGGSPQAIDPDFARYLPQSAGAVIHASDLASLITTALSMGTSPNPQDIETVFQLLGISFDDFLLLTKGDYAITAGVDLTGLLQRLTENNPAGIFDLLQLGIVIEATDDAIAAALADGIGDSLRLVVAQSQGAAVLSTEQIGSVEARVLTLSVPDIGALKLAVAANQDVFFIGTANAAAEVFGDGGGLATNPLYAESQRYWLADPTTVWYADGEGLVSVVGLGGVGGLALLGPAIGNVFTDIQDQLNDAGASAAVPAPTRVQDADQLVLLARVVNRLPELIRHSTITASATGDSLNIRATLTLGE
jgi:hypothetical protein